MDFKKMKKDEIQKGKETGEKGLDKGNERLNEATFVKSRIDNLRARDDVDLQEITAVEAMSRTRFKEAHKRETQDVVKTAADGLEDNKIEIIEEKETMKTNIDLMKQSTNATDVSRNATERATDKFTDSRDEYQGMEDETNRIVDTQKNETQNQKDNMDNIWN